MDIILIRHGQSLANKIGIFSDSKVLLSEKGKNQCIRTKDVLAGKLDDYKVLVSPYERAINTMELLGLDGEVEDNLREVNLGILEGKSYLDFEKLYPKEAKAWMEDPIGYALPDGESLLEAYERIKDVIDRLIKDNKDVVLVGHEGIIRLALCYVFEDPYLYFRFNVDNVSLSKITVHEGFKYINYMNRIYY